MSTQYDALVNMVAKAINTGAGNLGTTFFAGRVSGLVSAAATLAHLSYGCDYDQAKYMLRLRVKDLRDGLTTEDKTAPEVVGKLATEIVHDLLKTS